MNIDEYFQTSDLGLSATITLFFPLDCIDKADPKRAKFLFKNSAELNQLIEEYWKGQIKVNPQVYFNAIKNLKTRLYQ